MTKVTQALLFITYHLITLFMESTEQTNPPARKPTAADHLANERTFLAWIRTSIAVMGFGFVVVKFSLFIKQISFALGEKAIVSERAYSPVIGVILVIMGSVMTLLAFFRYRYIERKLQSGGPFPSILLSLVVTIAVVIFSIILVFYLLP